MRRARCTVALTLVTLVTLVTPAAAMTEAEVGAMLRRIEDRQRNAGDFKARVYIEQTERDGNDRAYEAVTYRRDADDKLMILFLEPRTEAGKGYLRIGRNLWMYDPAVGKWERRTERERIGGTDSRRADFDAPRYTEQFDGAFVAAETLGRFAVHHIRLMARKGVDAAYPTVDVWIDSASENVLKQEERALSGRLMRTLYYPKWHKAERAGGGALYYPNEIRIFDEVERGNRTLLVVRQIDLEPLPANLFTKAWLESKSR